MSGPTTSIFYHYRGDSAVEDNNPGETLPLTKASQTFLNFIRFYFDSDQGGDAVGTLCYREQLTGRAAAGEQFFDMNISQLQKFNGGESLVDAIRQKPLQYLPVLEESLSQLWAACRAAGSTDSTAPLAPVDIPRKQPPVQLRLSTDDEPRGMRDLQPSDIGQLFVVSGIVTRASTVEHQARAMQLMCCNCGDKREWRLQLGMEKNLVPRVCQAQKYNQHANEYQACPKEPYRVITENSQYWDVQKLRLQELPEQVPMGDTPRSIVVHVNRSLCDIALPGARVRIVCIYASRNTASKDLTTKEARGGIGMRQSYLIAVGMDELTENLLTLRPKISSGLTLSIQQRAEQLARRPDIREIIASSIAPALIAHGNGADIKKALACLLFGGTRKRLPDGSSIRGDINVLLLGDPGTGKSQYLKFVNNIAPVAVFTSGRGSSAAGLTASIIRQPGSLGFTIEGGAMVLADGGTVCIDEFDKMRPEDQVSIHEAMEQQTISLAKAGITTKLNTRCSVLAAANPTFGTYDDTLAGSEQIAFGTTILSRFDMIFIVRDSRDRDRDRSLARHIIDLHTRGSDAAKGKYNEESIDSRSNQGVLCIDELREYIQYAKHKTTPKLSKEASTHLVNFYVNSRRKAKEATCEGKNSAIPITVRQLEAMVRISESFAKMELQDNVTLQHAQDAEQLFTVSTLEAGDHTAIAVGRATESTEEIRSIEIHIKSRIPIGSKVAREVLLREHEGSGGKRSVMLQALRAMELRGEIQVRADMTVFRVM